MTSYKATKTMRGRTLIQTMLILIVAGILGTVLVNFIIDQRCEADPTREMCKAQH